VQETSRGTVRLADLFDRVIRYRNRELGQGATGIRLGEFYEAMGRTMLVGIAELLDRVDVLAGRRLVYIDEIRLQKSGNFLIDRYLLAGESARRLESLERLASDPDSGHYRPGQVYAVRSELAPQTDDTSSSLPTEHPPPSKLSPLVVYEPKLDDILFLNARRTRQRCEYLCYTTGMHEERAELEGEHRQLLALVLGVEFDEGTVESLTSPPPPPTVVDEGQGAEATAPNPGNGRKVGEFELLSELGHGNMGKVYRAWQPSLGRQVALKMISRADDARARARFHREIRALGRVDHPHLVKIFTSGFDEDPSFYTMELVEGVTMAAICERLHSQTSSASCIDLETWQASLGTACEASRRSEKPLGAS
ncbi:protein kinase domain-containing protein, partial [Singulisphaera rosea]